MTPLWVQPEEHSRPELEVIRPDRGAVEKSFVAAVCDHRFIFISMESSARIERRYNCFTSSKEGIGTHQEQEETLI